MKLRNRTLVIILAALAVAALAVIPQFVRASRAGKQLLTKTMLTTTALAIHNFYQQEGRWPESLDALQQSQKGKVYIDWRGYPKQDAWQRTIIYKPFDRLLRFGTVSSYGSDGKPGGEGFAEDLEVRFGLEFPTWEQIQTNAATRRVERTGARR